MQKSKLKVGAYCRVSTDKDDQANSLASQRRYFKEYIVGHEDWELIGIYFDEGISGTQTKNREGFNRMIQDALTGRLDLILTKEVSRFARNTVDTLSYTRKLKQTGVGVIFVTDNIDTRDPDAEFRLSIMAGVAQEESRKTSERVKWGQKRSMERGVVFGRDMLGYHVEDGKLTVNEEEVPIVQAIFHKYTNEGKGTTVIARELLEEGMQPKKTTHWSGTVILRVLKNEKYAGDLCQKKTFTPDFLTHKKKYNRGEEKKVYLKDHHEAVIDRDLWNRTQEELKRRARLEERKSKYSNRYWCSGKICCGECGRRFVSRTKTFSGGNSYQAWRCYTKSCGSLKKDADEKGMTCENGSVNDRTLRYCMGYCLSLIPVNQDDLKKEILCETAKVGNVSVGEMDAAKIQRKMDHIEQKKRKAVDAMLDGLLTKEDLKKQTDWYQKELERLKQRLSGTMSTEGEQSRSACDTGQYEKVLDDIMKYGEDDEVLYREMLDHMDVYKDAKKEKRIDIWLKGLPAGIRLRIKTSGKREYFKVEILETAFISPD